MEQAEADYANQQPLQPPDNRQWWQKLPEQAAGALWQATSIPAAGGALAAMGKQFGRGAVTLPSGVNIPTGSPTPFGEIKFDDLLQHEQERLQSGQINQDQFNQISGLIKQQTQLAAKDPTIAAASTQGGAPSDIAGQQGQEDLRNAWAKIADPLKAADPGYFSGAAQQTATRQQQAALGAPGSYQTEQNRQFPLLEYYNKAGVNLPNVEAYKKKAVAAAGGTYHAPLVTKPLLAQSPEELATVFGQAGKKAALSAGELPPEAQAQVTQATQAAGQPVRTTAQMGQIGMPLGGQGAQEAMHAGEDTQEAAHLLGTYASMFMPLGPVDDAIAMGLGKLGMTGMHGANTLERWGNLIDNGLGNTWRMIPRIVRTRGGLLAHGFGGFDIARRTYDWAKDFAVDPDTAIKEALDPMSWLHTGIDAAGIFGVPFVSRLPGMSVRMAGRLLGVTSKMMVAGGGFTLEGAPAKFTMTPSGRALDLAKPATASMPYWQRMGAKSMADYLTGAARASIPAALDAGEDPGKFLQETSQGALLNVFGGQLGLAARSPNWDRLFTYVGAKPGDFHLPIIERTAPGDPNRPHPWMAAMRKAFAATDASRGDDLRAMMHVAHGLNSDVWYLPEDLVDHIHQHYYGEAGSIDGFIGMPGTNVVSDHIFNPDPTRPQVFIKQGRMDWSGYHEGIGHTALMRLHPEDQQAVRDFIDSDPNFDKDKFVQGYVNDYSAGAVPNANYYDLPTEAQVTPGNPAYDPAAVTLAKKMAGLTKERALNEAAVENIASLWSGGGGYRNWAKNPSLARQIGYHIAATADALGLPTVTDNVNGPIGVNKSVILAKALDPYLRMIAQFKVPGEGMGTPILKVPGQPEPIPSNILPFQPTVISRPVGGAQPTQPVPPDESVIKGLMKKGFTRAQAEAVAAKATVGGITQTGTFRQPPTAGVAPPVQPQIKTKGPAVEHVPEGEQKPLAEADSDEYHRLIDELVKKGHPDGVAQAIVEGRMRESPSGPGTQKMPSAEPAAPATGGLGVPFIPQQDEKKGAGTTLRATWFGLNPNGSIDRTDESTMSYYDAHHGAWGENLLNPNLVGVALPPSALRAHGIDPSQSPSSQGYKVRVTAPNGQSAIADIVDKGPRHTVDMTYGLGKQLGLSDNSRLSVNVIAPDGSESALKEEGGPATAGTTGERAGAIGLPELGGIGGGGAESGAATLANFWAQPPRALSQEPKAPSTMAAHIQGAQKAAPGVPEAPGMRAELEYAQGPPAAPQYAEEPENVYPPMMGYGPTQIPPAPGPFPMLRMAAMARRRATGEEPEEEGAPEEAGPDNVIDAISAFQGAPSQNARNVALGKLLKLHKTYLPEGDDRVQHDPITGLFKGKRFLPDTDPVHKLALESIPEEQKSILSESEKAMDKGQLMHLSYVSAPSQEGIPPMRSQRTAEQLLSPPQARALGVAKGQVAGHTIYPTAQGVSFAKRKGENTRGFVQGISTSVAASNAHHFNDELGEGSPYPNIGGQKFHNDLRGYISNVNSGWHGDGSKMAPPSKELGIAPDPDYVPYRMKRREADFMNGILHNVAAKEKGPYATQVKGFAQAGGRLLTPAGEVNPIRQAIDVAQKAHRAQIAAEPQNIHDPVIQDIARKLWSEDVLEPTIQHYRADLIHKLHKAPEEMAEPIRPLKGTEKISEAIGRRGLPQKSMVAAGYMPRKALTYGAARRNQELNKIKSDYAAGAASEPEVVARLKDLGEDVTRYHLMPQRGILTPHGEGPEPLSEEEHKELTGALRKKYLGGSLSADEYRQRLAEVPLPERLSEPSAAAPAPTGALGASYMPRKGQPGQEAPAPREITPETREILGPQPRDEEQAALWQQAGERLDTQVPEGIPLEPDRKENGEFKSDEKGKVLYKKTPYGLANAPLLQEQGKALGLEANKKTGKMGMAKPPEDVEDDLDTLDPEKRLTPFLNPTDRKRVAYLNDVSAVDTYADELHKMYKGIAHLPEVMKGKDWYDEAVGLLRKHFGAHADLMANLLGATSAGNKVKINYNMAMDAYHQYLRGHYDKSIELYKHAYGIQQSGKGALMKHIIENKIHEKLKDKNGNPLAPPDTDERAMLHWIQHHNLTPRSSGGALFGHNSLQVLKVLAHTWEKEIRFPKTPNFAANLSGRSLQATIDMWAARTMRRIGFEGHTKEPWMIQPAGETSVNNVDFGLSQLAFKKAADRIGIKPSSLQAILWFAEQKEWQKRNWEREQDPDERDYRPMLKAYKRPEDITKKQATRYHPSVPELQERLKGETAA